MVSKQSITNLSPIWLRVHPSDKILYSINRSGVSAFRVNPATGALTIINSVITPGSPVFIDIDPSGTNLFVASYSQGSIMALPIGADGSLGAVTSSVVFHGHGPNPDRQDGPHPHSINVIPKSNGRFVLVPDLGLDIVFSFAVRGGMFSNTSFTSTTTLYPGAGPRHMAFHPTLSVAYVLSEMGSTITVFKLDENSGSLQLPPLQTLKTLPADFTGFSKAAEVIIHPSGSWLLASNRGPVSPSNSIAVFRVGVDGLLLPHLRFPSGGSFPRGVVLSREGDTLITGGQDSNNVASFKFDSISGILTPTGSQLLNVATPVAFAFVPQQQ